MKILLFADLHTFNKNNINKITSAFDFIIFLGDIKSSSIQYIISCFPDKKVYGILGNHDDRNVFYSVSKTMKNISSITGESYNPIVDIHLRKIDIDRLSFTGFEGSVIYNSNKIGFTQEEALNVKIPEANILFSHETGYHYIERDKDRKTHEGFKTISKYIEKVQPEYHFFGHHHIDCQFDIGKTKCYGIYGCSVFDYENETIKKIF